MKISIEWKRLDDENFNLRINGTSIGNWHLSQMRHLIQETDNAIENYTDVS